MNVIRWVIPTVLASVAVFGQTPPVRLEFEVASIKASSPSPTGQVDVGMKIDGAQLHCANLSLREYVRLAYRVKDHQISGPDWLASARFDIAAKLPAGAKREQVPGMMQSLLAARFEGKKKRET